MSDLVDQAIAGHGGLERWERVNRVRTHALVGGALWQLKGQPGLFADATAEADAHTPQVAFTPFGGEGFRAIWEPDELRVEGPTGEIEQRRADPRAAFAGHELTTQWDPLHALYFAGYAIWTYLTLPFLLAEPGFATEEIEPWQEDGETWRRLRVTFPATVPSHSTEQVLYIDGRGLIRRHDYVAEVVRGAGAAHYLYDHTDVDSIVFPLRRRVYGLHPDNTPVVPEPVYVTINFTDYVLL